MRALRLFAVGLGAGLFAMGCGKDHNAPGSSLTASFTASCSSLNCTFTDHSTTDGSAISTWQWTFGDGGTSTEQSPAHTYSVAQLDTMTTTLIVTNADGAADTVSQDVFVAPPASLQCGSGACDLVTEDDAVVTVTLESSDCRAHGDTFVLTSPVVDTLFKDGCYATTPQSFQLNGGNAFTAGAHLQAEVLSGTSAVKSTPSIRVTGAYPTWTLEFDDGEGCAGADPTCGGTEPDYNDLIMTIHATPVP